MPQVYVTFSTDGHRLWGSESLSPEGPWLSSGEAHCRKLLAAGQAKPVGSIAEEIFAISEYQRMRDARAEAIKAKTGWPMVKVLPAARNELAAQGIDRPKNSPAWL